MLISISGLSGCGKDTSAQYLYTKGFQIFSWGTALRLYVANNFTVPLPERYQLALESSPYYLEADKEWERESGFLECLTATPTDIREQIYHQNLLRLSSILKGGENLVINDTRFPRELEAIKKFNGVTVWLERVNRCRDAQPHDSYLDVDDFDWVIKNDGTIDDLYRAWDCLLVKLRAGGVEFPEAV